MKNKIIFTDIVGMVFILLFTYAAISKLLDYDNFRIEMGKSPLLAGLSNWMAWALPVLELIIAFILAIPVLKTIGLYMSFTIMVMFTTYLIIVLHFSEYVPCTCGGLIEKMSWNGHIAFNILFIILSFFAILKSPTKKYPIDITASNR